MTYEQHPLGACYPPLSADEFAKLKASLHDPGTKPPAILFEGKILDGWHYYKACLEEGIAPKFETPKITNPLEFVTHRNAGRRNLSVAARAEIAIKMANVLRGGDGSNQYKKKERANLSNERLAPPIGQKDASKAMGISEAAFWRKKRVNEKAIGEVKEALAAGKISLGRAGDIALLPREKQASELAKWQAADRVPERKPKKRPDTPAKKEPGHGRAYWWEQWKTREPKQAAHVFAPSIYPEDARIPSGGGDEKFVREAIATLREHEAAIATLKIRQLDDLIYPNTQAVQTYVINRTDRPRPEGKLDNRFWDWARDVAKKMINMQNFYQFCHEQKNAEQVAEEQRLIDSGSVPRLSLFDANFNALWNAQLDHLSNFKRSEVPLLKERWLARVDKNFQIRAKRAEKVGSQNGS
jgi:hypothetical protein